MAVGEMIRTQHRLLGRAAGSHPNALAPCPDSRRTLPLDSIASLFWDPKRQFAVVRDSEENVVRRGDSVALVRAAPAHLVNRENHQWDAVERETGLGEE